MRNVITLQSSSFHALFCLLFLSKLTIAADTLSPSRSLKDGDTLVSPKEEFELGFFSPGTSTNRYLGIWYKKIPIPTFVWVANRNNPISKSTGVLQFSDEGNLVLVNGSASIVWSANASTGNPVAQLMDSGNFVIREEGNLNPDQYLWQSFDHPTDTLLPGMKVGWNLKTRLERNLTSWRAADDPSIGDYSFLIDLRGLSQGFIYNGRVPKFRSGSWNGKNFAGVPGIVQSYIFNFRYVINQEEVSYAFYMKNQSIYSRLVLNHTGVLHRYTWLDTTKTWNLFWSIPYDICDTYMECGNYGICNRNNENTGYSICNCMKGYEPKDSENWYLRDWTGGCVQKIKYECQKNDGFLTMNKIKLPDTSRSFVNESMNIEECGLECRKNCSCKAYATYNLTNGGSGCIIWTDDLKDLREYNEGGQDLYLRVAASLIDSGVSTETKSKRKKLVKLIVTVAAISGTVLLGLSVCFIWKKKIKQSVQNNLLEQRAYMERNPDSPLYEVSIQGTRDYPGEKKDDLELVLFDMDTIVKASSNFSSLSMLGQGGFGCVYKGTLEDGHEIAVKRLSATSGQGVEEFQNEVVLIAKLQHRNLVRLLGICIDGDEKMLVYEYMKNKGLDSILFNKAYNSLLDWPKRFKIIMGISRGLLYLHQDSRFRIVHRDLKASNVLLDGDMNPKISDFGMARIFGGDDTEGKTKRVVGTYGYMSPEYAMDGLFSVKSDVFSFGVLVLEIISGKKNKGFFCSDDQLNLLRHAWNLWREGKALELIDESMRDSLRSQEALRCMQVGLLCVQERAEDRPTMSSVVLMLSSDSTTFPEPRQPGFSYVRNPNESESSSSKKDSVNNMTVTLLEPR